MAANADDRADTTFGLDDRADIIGALIEGANNEQARLGGVPPASRYAEAQARATIALAYEVNALRQAIERIG